MQVEMKRQQSKTLFGRVKYTLSTKLHFSRIEMDVAIHAGFLSEPVYWPPSLPEKPSTAKDRAQRDKEDVRLAVRVLVATATKQIIRVEHLLAGVTVTNKNLMVINEIEYQVHKNLETLRNAISYAGLFSDQNTFLEQ